MEHPWVLYALLAAFSLATSDALTKKALSTHNEYLIAWLRLLWSLPLLCLCLLFVPVPALDRTFFISFSFALPLEIAAIIFSTKALKLSPLSLTLPFLSLTPLFLLIVPALLLGETVSGLGGVGIGAIVLGSYLLNVREYRKGFFEPFAAIMRERGSLYMITVAFLYSLTSTLGKLAIEHSSALFFGAAYMAVLFLLFTPVALYKAGSEISLHFRSGVIRAAFLPGFLNGVMIIAHMLALSMTQVAYMISVKRLSLLIGIFYGYLFFQEQGLRERLTGGFLMFLGFVLIVLYH